MEQTAQGFTVTVTAALSGKLLCALTSQHAGSLYVRYLKLAIQKQLGLPSPFTVCLLKGTEAPDDFSHLQEITDTNELHLEFLLQKKEVDPQLANKWLWRKRFVISSHEKSGASYRMGYYSPNASRLMVL